MRESEVMGNYPASFGERDGETRTGRIVKVRTVPTPLSPLLCNVFLHQLDESMEALGANRVQIKRAANLRRSPEYRKIDNAIYRTRVALRSNTERHGRKALLERLETLEK